MRSSAFNSVLSPAIVFVCLVLLSPNHLMAQRIVDPSMFQIRNSQPYTLDKGDTLGVFVEGVLGEVNGMPPVHQPPEGSKLPPSIGFPTPVTHDGTIWMPLVDPISVRGFTVAQVEELLKRIYRDGDAPIINERSRVIVTLMRERTVNVTVIREDQSQATRDPRFSRGGQSSGAVSARSDRSGRIVDLQLPAGENDMLTAMMQSGGLPGVNAEDAARVYRARRPAYPPVGRVAPRGQSAFPRSGQSSFARSEQSSFARSEQSSFARSGQSSFARSEQSPFVRSGQSTFPRSGTSRVRYSPSGQRIDDIALRSPTGFPRTSRSPVRLDDGDIVRIAARPTEVYYTGGLLGGGEFLIPRDRQLSVMEAISLAGGVPQGQQQLGIPFRQPSQLRVLRRNHGGQEVLNFDLRNGYSQRASQTAVRSGDYLILDFSPADRARNIGTGVFNTVGIRQLFR